MHNISKLAGKYIIFAEIIFVIFATICIALFFNIFGFIDRVNSYIIAVRLADGLLRMTAAAAVMFVIIDIVARSGE